MNSENAQIRGSIVTLSALVRALFETHADPTHVRVRFAEIAGQQVNMLRGSSDPDTRGTADAAAASLRDWLAILSQTPTQQRG